MTGAVAAIAAVGSTPSMSVTISPSSSTGTYRGSSNLPQNIGCSPVGAVVKGGLAPLSYLWTRIDSNPGTWTIGTPTASATNLTANSVGNGNDAEADFQVLVTDAAGVKASATVHASAFNDSTA